MTLDDVRDRLKSIYASSFDNEAAHIKEDRLHRAVLRSIADGTAENPREMAALALSSVDIEFARWYA